MLRASRDVASGSDAARTVRRVVVALSAAAFSEYCGATAVLPLLPIYLTHKGASPALVGVTMAAFFAAALAVQYPLGRLSDRLGRRFLQVGGLLTYAVASVLFAFLARPDFAFVLRGLQGCGAGMFDVANAATIADVVPESHRGRAYGTYWGAHSIAMAVGPFIGGVLGVAHMNLVFFIAAALSLLAVVPIVTLLPARRPVASPARLERGPRVQLWRNRGFLGVSDAFIATGLVIGAYEVCWSLLLQHKGASEWQIGLSWALFAVPFGLMSFPAGWLVDHFDRRYLVAVSLFGSAVFAAIYPFLTSVSLLIGLGCVEAVFVALGMPATSAQLAHSVPDNEFGRAQGAASSVQTGATAVAAGIAGTLFAVRPWIPFVGCAVCIGLGILALWPLWRNVSGRVVPGVETLGDPEVRASL